MYFSRLKESVLIFFIIILCDRMNASTISGIQVGGDSRSVDTVLVEQLNKKAFSFWSTNLDSLLILGNEAMNMSLKLGYLKGEADASKNLGIGSYEKGEYSKAIKHYTKSIQLYESLNDYRSYAQGLSNMSMPLIAIGAQDDALEYLYKALSIAEKHNYRYVIGHVKNSIGMVYHYQGKDKEALSNYLESKAIYASLGDSTTMTFILGNIGHIYANQNKADSAFYYYSESLKLADRYKNSKGIGNAVQSLGSYFISKGDYRQAQFYYEKARKVLEEIGEKTEYLRLLSNMSLLYQKLGKKERALDFAYQTYALAGQQGQYHYIDVSAGLISNILADKGNYKEALKYQKLSREAADSLNREGNKEKLVRLEEKYKYEKHQQEIDLEHDQKLSSKHNLLVFVSLITIGLVGITVLLIHNIQQRKKAHKDIQSAKEFIENQNLLLEKEDQFKGHLISIMAHDIRTPIANLFNIVRFIKDGLFTETMAQQMIDSSLSEINLLVKFVDDLLLWVNAQLHNDDMHKKNIDINTLVDKVLGLYQQKARSKEVLLETYVQEGLSVYGDEDMLKIVLRNLIDNGVKYSHKDSKVTVYAVEDDLSKMVRIGVKDTGIGMSEDIQSSLFTNTLQSRSGTDHEKGIGLGLRLCSVYVTRHDAELKMQSAKNKGTDFWFKLPLA